MISSKEFLSFSKEKMLSLHIKKINISYNEDKIIYIFWKHFLGKVYRVDFAPIANDDEYRQAFIYIEEGFKWNNDLIKSIAETQHYILYHTTIEGKEVCWTMYENENPIPKADTSLNIHQLCYENEELKTMIAELKKENDALKAQLK